MEVLPVVPVIAPLFAAALLTMLGKLLPRMLIQLTGLLAALVTLAADCYLMNAAASTPVTYWFGGWRPRNGIALGIAFVADRFGAGMAAFAALLVLAAFLFSLKYFDVAGAHFSALLLAFLAAMSGFCLTGDLFNLFVFFELMSAAAFALCGYKSDDPGSLQGALNFAVTNTIAAYLVLIGVALIYARTGALNMAQAQDALARGPVDKLVLIAFVFITFGYLTKAAIFPFHFWLADAHAVAPTPICILFSGVMVELGLFALGRLYWSVFQPAFHSRLGRITTLFVITGVITSLVGALMAYIQRNIKRLLAFSTISHTGLMLIGLGLFSPLGLTGSAVYMVGHGMVKAALFIVAGILLHRFGKIDERDLHGKARREVWTAMVYFAAALGLAGLPCSGIAAGHALVDSAAEPAGFVWVRWIFVFADGLTAAAVIRAGMHIFWGWGEPEEHSSAPKHEEKPETERQHQTIPATMFVPALALTAGGLFLGLCPGLADAMLQATAQFQKVAVAYHAPSYSLLDAGFSLGAVLIAIAIPVFHIFSPRTATLAAAGIKPLGMLHRIHSGHVGDYIAFLTFGMSCFGLLFAYYVR
jgi:multicomponent Na+:H+ antiporter subunit D